ncbi:alpha/beta fold hydrolase [Marinospirillum alkaliphilum]|nr:alpha/beta fold hydrolase [Marinospirillum alkaliphilum]
MPMIAGEQPLAAETALTLSTALHEIEQLVAEQDQLFTLINNHNAPAIALNEAGQILALNTAAAQLFHISTGDGLASLGIRRQDFVAFHQRLMNVPGPTLIKTQRLASRADNLPLIMMGRYNAQWQAFVLEALQHAWPQSIDQAIKALFGLSTSEREILSGLARGLHAEQLADERQRSVTTVRQQIKSLLQKMGVSSQLQAATLAATAAAQAINDRLNNQSSSMPRLPITSQLQVGEIMRAQRRIGWRRFGDPQGQKILMLHGPSFGAGEYEIDRSAATKHHLDVFAIERPGYGRTQLPNRSEDVLDCQINDLLAFMDDQQLEQVTLLAHEAGLIPALALACRSPERIKGILAISAAPPFQRLEQINAMPAHQAIFIQAARHAPWLARLMIRLLMVRTRHLGPERWTEVIFEGIHQDQQVIQRNQHRSGVIGCYSFYLNQLGAGFEVDLKMMLKDWSSLFSLAPCPVVLMHGDHNTTTPVRTLDIFRQLQPAADIRIIKNAGLTLALSHSEQIYQTLAEINQGRGISTPSG